MSRLAWPELVLHRWRSRVRGSERHTRPTCSLLDRAARGRRILCTVLERAQAPRDSVAGWALTFSSERSSSPPLGFLVVMAEGPYPIPSRTRKSSPPAPMVLQGPPCGRVGRRQIYAPEHSCSGAAFFNPRGGASLCPRIAASLRVVVAALLLRERVLGRTPNC